MTTTVRDNTDQGRYEVVVDDQVAGFTAYELRDDRITLTHTEVSDDYAGQGLAKELVTHALDDADRRNLGVVPQCSYVAKTIAEDPDQYLRLVPEDARDRLSRGDSS